MKKSFLFVIAFFALFFASTTSARADHSWGNYHWARTSNPFTLKLGNNMTSNWHAFLVQSSADWSLSDVLDTTIVAGNSNPKNCRPTAGRVEVCNSQYGKNGWLGIAQIWTSGDHITQGVTKMNDTYFKMPAYNTVAWKNLVLCQEIGHTFGLDHQDEAFDNTALGTCMDYTSDPTPNQHPNAHDYEQLETIYAHLDLSTTLSFSEQLRADQQSYDNPSDWGRQIAHEKGLAEYVRELPDGRLLHTFVIEAR